MPQYPGREQPKSLPKKEKGRFGRFWEKFKATFEIGTKSPEIGMLREKRIRTYTDADRRGNLHSPDVQAELKRLDNEIKRLKGGK